MHRFNIKVASDTTMMVRNRADSSVRCHMRMLSLVSASASHSSGCHLRGFWSLCSCWHGGLRQACRSDAERPPLYCPH